VGPQLLPISKAIQETGVFFLVVFCFLAAGVHAYYTIGPRTEPFPLYASTMQIFRLGILGDFDMYDFEGQDPVMTHADGSMTWEPQDPEPSDVYVAVHTIFYATSISITIILMNLLVGVLGSYYDVHKETARQAFLRERAGMLVNFEQRPWLKLWRRCTRSRNMEVLYVLIREEPDEVSLQSMRSVVKNELKGPSGMVKQIDSGMAKQIDSVMKEINFLKDEIRGISSFKKDLEELKDVPKMMQELKEALKEKKHAA